MSTHQQQQQPPQQQPPLPFVQPTGIGAPVRSNAVQQERLAQAVSSGAVSPTQDAPAPEVSGVTPPSTPPPTPVGPATLPADLQRLLTEAQGVRQQLDAASAGGGTPDPALVARLQALRLQQIPLWEAHVTRLEALVAQQQAEAAAQAPAAAPAGRGRGRPRPPRTPPPSAEASALREAQERLRRLRNWQARQRLGAIDRELASNPANAEALRAERSGLVDQMQRRVSVYGQADRAWGSQPFLGNDRRPLENVRGGEHVTATVQQGGCGPASLATVVDFLESEDPEAPIRTRSTQMNRALDAVYDMQARGESSETDAAGQRHRMANGTSWNRVAAHVGEPYAGLRGDRVSADQIQATLEGGHPVVWQKRTPAHFVVISRYDPAHHAQAPFYVSDPGFPNAWVSFQDIRTNTQGFWVLQGNSY